jgi:hypothetical protein
MVESMTLPFWIRKTEVEIEDIGRFRNGLFDGQRYDLDIFFDIKSNKDGDNASDKVEIYNIADQTRIKLMKLLDDRKSNKLDPPLIFVRSGYESKFGLIREGRIERVKSEHETTGDVKTTVSIKSGKSVLESLVMERTYTAGTPVKAFFEDVSSITGYSIGNNGIDSSYIFEDNDGFVVDKSRSIQQWIKEIQNRTKEKGEPCQFFLENQALYFLKQKQISMATVGIFARAVTTTPQSFHSEMKLDPQHGLLEAVECMDQEDDSSGLELTCFLIPGITNGLKIILTTQFPIPIVEKSYVVKEYSYLSDDENHTVKMKVYPCED